MSRRMSKQVPCFADSAPRLLSEFVENAGEPAYFTTRWVPLPPNIQRKIVRDPKTDRWSEQIYTKLGCPKCHEDIEFRYEAGSGGQHLFHDLMQVLYEIKSFEFSIAAAVFGRDSEAYERYTKLVDVAERLTEALRRW